MCRKVTCKRCGKAAWAGCGKHIEMVLKGISAEQRCSCEKPEIGGLIYWLFGR